MNGQFFAQLYDSEYYDGEYFDPAVRYLEDIKKEQDSDKTFRPNKTLEFIKGIVPPPATFLDFGCGVGDLAKQAIHQGYQAEGFEVSQFAAEFASNIGLKVYTDLRSLPNQRFDVVAAIEVLEHCESPMIALSNIYNSLKPGGLFYYTTCNFDGFYHLWHMGIKDSRDGYILPDCHIYFFKTSVMRAYFNQIGFSQLRTDETGYQKEGRHFKLLQKLALVDENRYAPQTFLEMAMYHGIRSIYYNFYFYKGYRSLPLARK